MCINCLYPVCIRYVYCVLVCVPLYLPLSLFRISIKRKTKCVCLVQCRNIFNVDPDTHIDSIQAAEQVILAGDWSAKLTITGL